MRLDVRVPIGAMFTLVGVVLVVYGLATAGSPIYQRSLNLNVNLWWGLVQLLFGAAMLAWAYRAVKAEPR